MNKDIGTICESIRSAQTDSIDSLLDALYDVPGTMDVYKRFVVVIMSQVRRSDMSPVRLKFLDESLKILESETEINQGSIDRLFDLIEELGLDPFRGTLSS